MLKKEVLKNLFKPYVLRFQKLEDLKDNNPRLDRFIDNILNGDSNDA